MTDLSICRNYVAGHFGTLDSDLSISIINPATEALIGHCPETLENEVDSAVAAAKEAQPAWRTRAAVERAEYLREIAKAIRSDGRSLARTISTEQGKTVPLAEAEVEFAAAYFEYTAEWARRIEGEIITSDRPDEHIFLRRKPIGVVAGILPWNFPFFLIARKTAPALLTGNTIVIKPSEVTPINCYEFAKLIDKVGMPPGVFNVVFGTGTTTGAALARHPDVGLITFTGSVATGRDIMSAASNNITKVNLELGGKAPVIVLDDADIDLAVAKVVESRVINTGQVCNCAERVYVQDRTYELFLDKLVDAMRAVQFGDPIAAHDNGVELDMGPLITKTAVKKVSGIVDAATGSGAEPLLGAKAVDNDKGYYYLPTVLSDCRDDMAVMRDEVFGPVLPVRAVSDLDEAIHAANSNPMGLTSSIFTSNLNAAMKASRELQFGETYVNREHMEAFQGFHAGVRQSGIGGADGKHGLYEYMQTHVTYFQET